jgi:hypothetical protein
MKASLQLLGLPARRMPLGCALVALMYAGSIAGMFGLHSPVLIVLVGMAGFFWHILAGFTLGAVLRPETLMLPRFRRHFALAAAIDGLLTIIVPVVLLAVVGSAAHVLLAGALLLFVMATGIAIGFGLRITLLIWVGILAAGWMPAFTEAVMRAALHSPLTPLLLVLVAMLLLVFALRPRLIASDREIPVSPLEAVGTQRNASTGADGTPRRRGIISKQLVPLLDRSAQRALEAALQRFRRHPGAAARINLVRAVLLPHDNPLAVGLNLLVLASVATIYFFATHAAGRWNAGYVGAYAVIISISRFAAVGNGMRRMRPNLTDLYFSLAPKTRSEFQATLADALLWLVGVAVFNCLAFTLLIVVLLHAQEPARLLLASGISAIGCAFGALGMHLVGPESPSTRSILHLVMAAIAAGSNALVYWLLGRFGLEWGAAAGMVLMLPFGLGAWLGARRDYLQRTPRFDAPLT